MGYFSEYIKGGILRLKTSKKGLATSLGINPSQISGWINDNIVPHPDRLAQIIEFFGDDYVEILRNIELDKPTQKTFTEKRRDLKNTDNPKIVKLYNASVAATPKAANDVVITDKSDFVNIYDVLGKCDFALQVSGNSMMPNYPPSSIVGMLKKTDWIIRPGEVYVIETVDEAVVKRLFYKDDDSNSDVFVLVSDNAMILENGARIGKLAYPPYDLHKKDIVALYSVTGSSKRMFYGTSKIQL